MATERFNNLKSEKRLKIFDAIKHILIKKNYDDTMTSDIIESSGISRGSFYTYFYDKRDAVQSTIIHESKSFVEMFKKLVIELDGDYFKAVEKAYEYVKSIVKNNYYQEFRANFSFITDMLIELFERKEAEEFFSDFNKWCIENSFVKTFHKNISLDLADHINILTIQAFINALTQRGRFEKNKLDISKIDDGFKIELEIIKNGVMAI